MTNFEVLGLAPADLPHAGIAVAVSRNGGTGLLDLEFAHDAERIAANFTQLLDGGAGAIGLRVTAAQAATARELLAGAGERVITLILAGAADSLQALRQQLALRPQDRCLAEIRSAADALAVQDWCDGIVARGHEAGGWVGEDSSYILLQKLQGKLEKPLFLQGGIGLRATAACRSAGAAGVILDDCLLLMAESALPVSLQTELARLNGAECKPLGDLLGAPCRVYARPSNPAMKTAEEATRNAEGGSIAPADWAQQLRSQLGWQTDALLPLGQGIGLAAIYRERYRSVGHLVQAARRTSLQQIERAAALSPLAEAAPLAQSHGTRYPLAQGPMTRVSDSPAFAVEVAKAGALPFLALALMRGTQVREMLQQTRAQIGDLPWGVGMLGFVPQALRDEQCAEVWACKPSYALIAGGRPDQAAEFESRGIPTYIHAPAPSLLKLYLEQGARRFVFEGRECGGHVGPIGSFPLWEQMIEVLLTQVPAGAEKQIHVLFAGGIHDAVSAAMVAAMTAPLAERGMKVGALMGTAYLFTQEIVSSGAVVAGFQEEALRCERTLNLESGPGHASRCVDTQFARDFYDTRRRLIREGRSSEEIRDALEELNLGRLRIASKGVDRDASGQVVSIADAQQRSDGMYMIGQVATLRAQALPLAQLHEEVCAGAQQWLQEQCAARGARAAEARPADIAIVGIGVTLPKVNDADDYWQLIVDQTPVLRDAPTDRWDTDIYFDADPKARDKIYSRRGGFLDEIPFDPLKFGIPPKSMKSIDPLQLLTLETAARTLADAGYADGQFDRENSSVILGAGGGAGDLGQQYAMRAELPRFVENLSPEVWERLPEWTEESFAGTLLNVAAGRVANRLDFGGVNYTVDAACGSSLAAISLAVHELETGRSNLVLAGGFDTTQSAFAFTAFAKTQALSASGQPRTFDQAADGIAISEGVAMVALKRLADAERDGDRIYAVIKATAGSSDGKALGLTAPRSEGQVRALQRAYRKAGFSPATLGLVEAHGTGTPVGDRTEAQTVARALNDAGAAPRTAAIGSVKTLLGHTKAAAGAAGMIKVALSLYHRVLPGHYGVSNPIDVIADPASPVYLLKNARPWLAAPDHPRRGAASAFGFGGTNFHAVLEEYRGNTGSAGGRRWPAELFLFRAADSDSLIRELERIQTCVADGSRLKAGELALALARQADLRRGQPLALAVVATSLQKLAKDLTLALAHLRGDSKPLPPHIRLNRAVPAQAPKLAFLFPGQGAQYVDMGREAAIYLDEVRSALALTETTLQHELPERLSTRMYPPAAFDAATETAQAAAITDTRYAQPAIGALSLGYLRFARRLGISAVATAGHSYGEYSALMAAGTLAPTDFLKLSAERGRAMAEAARVSVPGGMAAVQARREQVEALIAEFGEVRVANHNAPEQSVISGPRAQLDLAVEKLGAAGLRAVPLAVSGAFHTDLVAPAKTALSQAIHATDFAEPRCTVYANQTAQPYPNSADAMRRQLDEHLLSSVEFVAEIDAMYAAGCRVFLELGPRGICSTLTRQILAERGDAVATSLDANGHGIRGLLLGLAELFIAGVPFEASALYAGRDLALLDAAQLPALAQPQALAKHLWMLSGGCARPQDDPQRRTGKLPALTKASSDTARKTIEAQMEAAIRARLPAAIPTASGNTALPNAASTVLNSEALIAYQQTMRQFLALQERVVQQFLQPGIGNRDSGTAEAASLLPAPEVGTPPTAPPIPNPQAAIPAAVTNPESPIPIPGSVDFQATLLAIVAERTGYPTDMLGLDADLEADLGIDSIKRVEIIGGLQKALPEALAAGIKQRMERYTKAKTLDAILGELHQLSPLPLAGEGGPQGRERAGAAGLTAPVARPSPPPPLPRAGEGSIDFQPLLLNIVAERTGYPTDMLGLDADLEADLGIDSIKRVEIIGGLQKALPEALAVGVKQRMERYTKAKTLSAILAELATLAPANVVTASAPAATATPVSSVDFQATLLAIVAERTGYPTDMLGLDADLEADLGIDSIKRVEIIGGLQKALPEALAVGVKQQMERYTKAKTLGAILGELHQLSPLPLAGEGGPQGRERAGAAGLTAPPAPLPQAGEGRIDFQSLLLDIVAERTGYPTDMLGLDADLEADLGIDSIKRVEIIGGLQKALPEVLAAGVKQQMERYTKAKTLSAILAELAALDPGVAAPTAAAATTPDSRIPNPASGEPLPRFVIKSQPATLSAETVKLHGLALILSADKAISSALAQQLSAQGLSPVVIASTEPTELRAAISAARERHGPMRVLLHLHGLEMVEAENLEQWRQRYQRDLLSLFHGLQVTLSDLDGARVFAASRLGGTFGRDAIGEGLPVAGGVNGMLNCLRVEYPQSLSRTVDFDGHSDDEIVHLLCAELFSADHASEAGYIQDQRYIAVTRTQALAASPFPSQVTPSGDWVLLATGGARGITAQIVEELARPGMQLVLLGRTAEPAAEDAATAQHGDVAALKKALLAASLAKGERPKPVEIDRAVSKLMVDREVRENIARLRATGAVVEYVPCDVRNEAALGELIDQLYARHGRIDAVIHGAGVIEDKLLADKTAESFERVLGTKLDPAFVFSRKLRPESLKLLAFFTSVAGRYGNRGQSDYAAANEALNRLAWELHRRWPQTRVLAVNWGPWDAGMASEGIKRALRERGMEPIPVPAGRRFFSDELVNGPRNDVELVAGQGPWGQLDTAPDHGSISFAFVIQAAGIGAGGAVTLQHRLMPSDLPAGTSTTAQLSETLAAQCMSQFVAANWQGWRVAELQHLRVTSPLQIDAQGCDIVLRARAATHSQPGMQAISVELGAVGSKGGAQYRATVVLVPQNALTPVASA